MLLLVLSFLSTALNESTGNTQPDEYELVIEEELNLEPWMFELNNWK